MSDISLNVAPAPELLKPATGPAHGPNRTRPEAAEGGGPTNPFATLLSGVLGGTQPPASSAPATPDIDPTEPATAADAAPPDTTLLAVPGSATPVPFGPDAEAAGLPASPGGGNPLPLGGSSLPPGLASSADPAAAATGLVPDGTPNLTRDAAPDPGAATVDAGRPRTSLADLALSRPLDTAPAPAAPNPAAAAADDGARTAAAAALAGRAMPANGKLPDDAAAQSAYLTRFLNQDPGTTTLADGTGTTAGASVGADLVLRLRGADLARLPGLPGAATEFLVQAGASLSGQLAGQLAAFAAGSDAGGSAMTTAPATAGVTATDGGSASLLNRLGSTSLPALQPLADAGSFAGGLADRLLTVGGPGTHTARLKLHPENLGELDVEITMDDGTAQVWFGTTTSQARDAIEGSLPRLRELFADQGIDLTRTQIDAGGGQTGNSGFGQDRRMTGGAAAWNDVPAWQASRTVGGAEPVGRPAAGASARLLDVWA